MNKYTTDNMGMVYKNSLLITDGEVVGDIKQMQSQIEQLTKEKEKWSKGFMNACDKNNKLTKENQELKLIAKRVQDDLLMRADIDSDNMAVVDLSSSVWESLKSIIDPQIDDLIYRKIND